MVKVCVIMADGFEEIELVSIVDILRRGGERMHHWIVSTNYTMLSFCPVDLPVIRNVKQENSFL